MDDKKLPTLEEIKAKLNEIWDDQGFSCEPDGQGNYIIQDKGSFCRVNAELFDKHVRASWEEESKKHNMTDKQVLDSPPTLYEFLEGTEKPKNGEDQKSIKTYKFYTSKGERLGIFLDNDSIVVIRCSLKDQFCKKTARNLFSIYKLGHGYTPEVYKFDHSLNGKEFFDWCKDKYYIKTETRGDCRITWLVNRAKMSKSSRIVLKSVPSTKMGY